MGRVDAMAISFVKFLSIRLSLLLHNFGLKSKFATDDEIFWFQMYRNSKSFHKKLVASNGWFIHETPYANLASIRSSGLKPHCNNRVKKFITDIFGQDADKITCLRPCNAHSYPISSGQSPFMLLAIRSEKLTQNISLDWSFPDSISYGTPNYLNSCNFYESAYNVAMEYGSIISYDRIELSHLLVKTVKSTDCPSTWLPLEDYNTQILCYQ